MSENNNTKQNWSDLQKEAVKTREQFLELFPDFEPWLLEAEKFYGKFLGINSITFADKRVCFLQRYEKCFRVEIDNPNNSEAKQTSFTLSPEGFQAMIMLYRGYECDDDIRAFWKALGTDDEKIEIILAERHANIEVMDKIHAEKGNG